MDVTIQDKVGSFTSAFAVVYGVDSFPQISELYQENQTGKISIVIEKEISGKEAGPLKVVKISQNDRGMCCADLIAIDELFMFPQVILPCFQNHGW